jgi:hypothetical protein
VHANPPSPATNHQEPVAQRSAAAVKPPAAVAAIPHPVQQTQVTPTPKGWIRAPITQQQPTQAAPTPPTPAAHPVPADAKRPNEKKDEEKK